MLKVFFLIQITSLLILSSHDLQNVGCKSFLLRALKKTLKQQFEPVQQAFRHIQTVWKSESKSENSKLSHTKRPESLTFSPTEQDIDYSLQQLLLPLHLI